MAPLPRRVLVVDWSGAASSGAQRRGIACAEAADGRLVSLALGATRAEVVTSIEARLGATGAPVLVGIDCSFSLPAWWLDDHGLDDGPALWAAAAAHGERWLAEAEPPFWGRAPQATRPAALVGAAPWRACELALRAAGHRPSSTFQVGGAGAVGTGSVRAWPHLRRLRGAGAAVWPFDPVRPGGTSIVEVWPRLAAPGLRKADAGHRARAAAALPLHPDLDRHAAGAIVALAARSHDALDAALAAAWLARATVPTATDLPTAAAREGWVVGATPAAPGRAGG